MAALAQQAVQVQRQRGRQRLSFARLHLDDRAMEHGDAAEHLHVEVPHVDGPPAGLADQGVAFDQQPRQRLAALGAVAQRKAPLAELLVAELLQFRLQAGDLRQQRGPTRQPPAIQAAVQARQLRPNDVRKLAHGALAGVLRQIHDVYRAVGSVVLRPRLNGADDRLPPRQTPLRSRVVHRPGPAVVAGACWRG